MYNGERRLACKGVEPDLLTCTMVKEDWHGKGVEPDLLTCTMVKRRLA
jgi:hypothetical protein